MANPSVFLIGDSISIDYGPIIEEHLLGRIDYHRKEGLDEARLNLDEPQGANGGDSARVSRYLKAKAEAGEARHDLLLVNCGLHDIKVSKETGEICITEAQYRENLSTILEISSGIAERFAWISTTPVDDVLHANRTRFGFHRTQANVDRYNAIAADVFAEVPSIDLAAFTANLGEEIFRDGVHFSKAVIEKQGIYMAGIISGMLS